jgi:hypothetical protein
MDMKSKLITHRNGDEYWELPNGKMHREDGPAVVYFDGDKEWWINGKLHRKNGPAVEINNGDEEWWLDGKLHREDGPAIEYSGGSKSWYLNGIFHTKNEYKFEMRSKKLKQLLK